MWLFRPSCGLEFDSCHSYQCLHAPSELAVSDLDACVKLFQMSYIMEEIKKKSDFSIEAEGLLNHPSPVNKVHTALASWHFLFCYFPPLKQLHVTPE